MYHDPRLIQYARQLRRDLTPAEKILWQRVRGRQFGGFRFRRQHVIDPYIADFYCAVAALIVELDGETHLGKEEADQLRQNYLESKGLKVLRFWNTDIFENLESVLEVIYRECQERANTAAVAISNPGGLAPHPQPLSPEGRGEEEAPHPSGERG